MPLKKNLIKTFMLHYNWFHLNMILMHCFSLGILKKLVPHLINCIPFFEPGLH